MFFLSPFARIRWQIDKLRRDIMATQAELAQDLRDLKAQNEKAAAEQAAALAVQLAAVKALEEALAAAGGTTAEVDAALADLKASIQAEDDLNPDAPPTP